MSYATLDEAFGTTFNRCENKITKKKKPNCNKDKTSFTVNKNDSDIDTSNIYLKSKNTPESNNIVNDTKVGNLALFNNTEYFENYRPNEIFEYSEDENRIIPENTSLASDSETDVEPVNNKVVNKVKNNRRKNKNKDSQENPMINEMNNKINFLINQLNNNGEEDGDNSGNVHDIILFILFGVFVIIILEILYKLVVKLYKFKMLNQ